MRLFKELNVKVHGMGQLLDTNANDRRKCSSFKLEMVKDKNFIDLDWKRQTVKPIGLDLLR